MGALASEPIRLMGIELLLSRRLYFACEKLRFPDRTVPGLDAFAARRGLRILKAPQSLLASRQIPRYGFGAGERQDAYLFGFSSW